MPIEIAHNEAQFVTKIRQTAQPGRRWAVTKYQPAQYTAGHRQDPRQDKAVRKCPGQVGYGCAHLQGSTEGVIWVVEANEGLCGDTLNTTVTANADGGDLFFYNISRFVSNPRPLPGGQHTSMDLIHVTYLLQDIVAATPQPVEGALQYIR